MGKLARVCAVLAVWLGALQAFPQAAVISDQAIDQFGAPLPYAQVRVCSVTSTGTPCSPTVPIYQDYGLTIPASDPYTADQYGNYTVYAPGLPSPNLYTVQISPASGITWSRVYNGPYCSLSGCTINGNVIINGNLTVNGNLNACSVNGVINATCETGSDIGAKINAALQSCTDACTVFVPAGTYSFSTTVLLPLTAIVKYSLECDQGAVLDYTGSGDAIGTYIPGNPTVSNLIVQGCQITAQGGGVNGVHILATNSVTIERMVLQGFTNGILLEGPNTVTVFNNTILNNTNGVQLSPTFCNSTSGGTTCSPTGSGAAYTTNAIRVISNAITSNSHWGIYDSNIAGANTGSLNNLFLGNDLEGNGAVGGSAYGAMNISRGTGMTIESNYFEGSPRGVVLGIPSGGSYYAVNNPNISDNYFTLESSTPFYIELEDTTYAQIESNSTVRVSATSSDCFVNALSGGEDYTYYGVNQVASPVNPTCVAGVAGRITGTLGDSYQALNTNYIPYIADGNYVTLSTGTSETVAIQNVTPASYVFITPFDATAAAAFVGGAFQVVAGSGLVTYTHPAASNGIRVNIWAALGPTL